MMELLVPLGLLGLIGILILIIIYIIKPNYLVKNISSTYVWKLSLKYRRKKLPTSMLRNILIFLCQLFILALLAGVLSMPVISHANEADENDVIAIIESSASMYAGSVDDTRWMRALDEVSELADRITTEKGTMSVIIANDAPYYLAERYQLSKRAELLDSLRALIEDDMSCSYGTADIDGAMALCESVLIANPSAKIYLYTGTTYDYVPKNVSVVQVGEKDWWNAAILDASAEIRDIYYDLTVEVAAYGRDCDVDIEVEVSGMNAGSSAEAGSIATYKYSVPCDADSVKTVVFTYGAEEEDSSDVFYYDLSELERFYSYQNIHITLNVDDDFTVDNNFDVYGGQKDLLKVQYASSMSNPFVLSSLVTLQSAYRESGRWDLRYDTVPDNDLPETSGYDFYIFEHTMPDMMPTDGVVFLLDPDRGPAGSGIRVNGSIALRNGLALTAETPHDVMQHISADLITVTRFVNMQIDSTYDILMSCNSMPVLAVQNSGSFRVAVLGFSVHYSNIITLPEFFMLFYNLFEYFLPATTDRNAYAVGETIDLRARGSELSIERAGYPESRVEFVDPDGPISVTETVPGTYTVKQISYFSKDIPDSNLFVRIPRIESNIWRTEEALADPYTQEESNEWFDDLLIYLAAATVVLLFAEWMLHIHEGR